MSETFYAFLNHLDALPIYLKLLTLFLSIILEYIFPIFPGDTVIIFAGFLSAHGIIDLLEMIAVIALGSIIGGWITYQIGRYLHSTHAKSVWVQRYLPEQKIALFLIWYQKWGYGLLLVSRFIPGVRAFFFVAAGFCNLSIFLTLTLGTISSILFNTFLLLLGQYLGRNVELIVAFLQKYSIAGYVLLGMVAIIVLLYLFFKNRKNKASQ